MSQATRTPWGTFNGMPVSRSAEVPRLALGKHAKASMAGFNAGTRQERV